MQTGNMQTPGIVHQLRVLQRMVREVVSEYSRSRRVAHTPQELRVLCDILPAVIRAGADVEVVRAESATSLPSAQAVVAQRAVREGLERFREALLAASMVDLVGAADVAHISAIADSIDIG